MEVKTIIYHVRGEKYNIQLLKQKLNTFPMDEYGMIELSNVVLYILNTPLTSMFCQGKCKVLDIIDLSNAQETSNQISFEIECNEDIKIESFDKIVDELFVRYELDRLN